MSGASGKAAEADKVSRLLEQLSRELGKDAMEEANRRHPELRALPDAHVAELIGAVEYALEFQGWPRTVENAERCYRILEANGELQRIAGQYAPAPAPEGFSPKSGAVEEEFLRTAPIDEVGKYLQAKFSTG
jgi:hypothetical protein